MTGPSVKATLPPPGKLVSWIVSAVLIGWVVVYNILRLNGDNPSQAAGPSLVIGAAAGVIVLAAWIVVRSRLIARGTMRPDHAPSEIPAPEAMDADQRRVLSLLWPAVLVLAVVSIAVGGVMAYEWYDTDSSVRSTAKIILAGWDVLSGAWMVYEAQAMRRLDAEGLDSVALGALLTAVLAGVALSRDMVAGGQVVLIVLAGVVAAGGYLAAWRITRSRGLPWSGIAAGVIAALALILPLTV